jgi:hypothetical protein
MNLEVIMEFPELRARVETAIERFVAEDSYLLEVKANERSVTHWLAVYLQQELEEWDVDCEYNRNHYQTKKVHIPDYELVDDEVYIREILEEDIEYDDEGNVKYPHWVYPDIIVHHRDLDDNLLIIEAKYVSTSREKEGRDLAKIKAYMTPPLGYKYGLFLKLRSGDEPGVESCDWWLNHEV